MPREIRNTIVVYTIMPFAMAVTYTLLQVFAGVGKLEAIEYTVLAVAFSVVAFSFTSSGLAVVLSSVAIVFMAITASTAPNTLIGIFVAFTASVVLVVFAKDPRFRTDAWWLFAERLFSITTLGGAIYALTANATTLAGALLLMSALSPFALYLTERWLWVQEGESS